MIGQQLVGNSLLAHWEVKSSGRVMCSVVGILGIIMDKGRWDTASSTKSQEPGLTHDSKGTQGKRETCLRALWIKQNEGGMMLISVSNTLGK